MTSIIYVPDLNQYLTRKWGRFANISFDNYGRFDLGKFAKGRTLGIFNCQNAIWTAPRSNNAAEVETGSI